MARVSPSRVNLKRVTDNLRLASRKGDRAALTLALDQMKVLALSPRYWQKYLTLLRNPLARLADLLVIKQGERIAHQKGWKIPGGGLRPSSGGRRAPEGAPVSGPAHDRSRGQDGRSKRRTRRTADGSDRQTSLFD